MKTCCEKNGYPMGCCQGKKCPETESEGAILALSIIFVVFIVSLCFWVSFTSG